MQIYQKQVKKNIQTRVEKLLNLDDANFKLHTGMTKSTFFKLLDYSINYFHTFISSMNISFDTLGNEHSEYLLWLC